MEQINLGGVVVATFVSFAFGALWYSPLLFLSPWSSEAGIDPNAQIASPARVYGLTFVLTLVSATVLAVALGPQPGLGTAVTSALGLGVGMVATSMAINYQFADRSLLFWSIDAGFHVVRFALMGLVFGLWP